MTLNLAPDTEERLRSVAEMRGQDPEEALIAILNQALSEAESETQEEMLATLRASVEDYGAGRWMTIEEYQVKALIRRQKRNTHQAFNDTPTIGLAA